MAKRRRHRKPSSTPDTSPIRRRQRVCSPELSPFPEIDINWARVSTPPYRTQLNVHTFEQQLSLSSDPCEKSSSITTSAPDHLSSSSIVEYTRALSISQQGSPLRTSAVAESNLPVHGDEIQSPIEQNAPFIHSTPIVVQVCSNNYIYYSTS